MDFVGETREGLLVLKGNICVDDDNERMPSNIRKVQYSNIALNIPRLPLSPPIMIIKTWCGITPRAK